MPAPKSGKPGQAVTPAGPKTPEPADLADPGEMAELKTNKYEEDKPQPAKKDETKTSWIELEMVGEDDQPIPGETYRVTLPDGTVDEGTLDNKGFVRIDGIDPGTCQITFPNLDKEAWEKI